MPLLMIMRTMHRHRHHPLSSSSSESKKGLNYRGLVVPKATQLRDTAWCRHGNDEEDDDECPKRFRDTPVQLRILLPCVVIKCYEYI